MNVTPPILSENPGTANLKLSTSEIPPCDRFEWLREVICREYTQVEIVSPVNNDLSQDLSIYPWGGLQLSAIQSSAISLQRLPTQPYYKRQDAYFAVLLVAGSYRLEQNGREAWLQPGDLTLYDATQPHRIHCPGPFTKLILSIPRAMLRDRVPMIDSCMALRISGRQGIGYVASNFLRTSASQAEQLQSYELSILSDHALDLMTLAVTAAKPTGFNLSRSRAATLNSVKDLIERHLRDADLDSQKISYFASLSPRYINSLFEEEGTSLMRYVWKRRLEKCRKDISNPAYANHRLTDIAFRWGFNDAAHFSRAFKRLFGCSPREIRQATAGHHTVPDEEINGL